MCGPAFPWPVAETRSSFYGETRTENRPGRGTRLQRRNRQMKARIKAWLGGGLWSELQSAREVGRRVGRSLMNRFGPRRRLRTVRGTGLLLHLGCGPRIQSGWVNVDMFPSADAYFADLRDPLELPDGSVRHIHCEHLLEHLQRAEAQFFLGECRRVLAGNGSLRLILPDAEKYLRAYAKEDEAYFSALRHLGNSIVPLQHRMAIINQMFRMDGGHRYAWDFAELSDALTEAGFASIQRSRIGDVAAEFQIDGCDAWRVHESIYLNVSGDRRH